MAGPGEIPGLHHERTTIEPYRARSRLVVEHLVVSDQVRSRRIKSNHVLIHPVVSHQVESCLNHVLSPKHLDVRRLEKKDRLTCL